MKKKTKNQTREWKDKKRCDFEAGSKPSKSNQEQKIKGQAHY